MFFDDRNGDDVSDAHGAKIFVQIGPAVFFLPQRPHGLRRRKFGGFHLLLLRARRGGAAGDHTEQEAAPSESDLGLSRYPTIRN